MPYPAPSVLVKNELDPRTGIHIIQVGCKFIFDDGHNDNQSANTDIPPGGQFVLYGVHTDCCRAYVGMMQVRFPDGQTETLLGSKTVEAGYCGGQLIWHLVPAAAFSKSRRSDNLPLDFIID